MLSGGSRQARIVARAALALGLAALAASAAGTAGVAKVRFVQLPGRVVQGNQVTATVAAPSGRSCVLTVRYGNGDRQQGLQRVRAAGGRASWTWRVPLSAQAGLAKVTASCGGAGSAARSLIVVGQLIPPKISVVKDGFSIRPHDYGSGTDVSYGVILHNASSNADAVNVNVLVNFVLADNKLLGSQSSNLQLLRAGSSYALGANMGFPGAAPIARLEVVVQIGGKQPTSPHQPATANVVIEADQFKPDWVGDVAGELVNVDPKLTLQNASLSAVVFDKAGNVIGGGNGSSSFSLPPGTRAVFKLTSGFNAIPTAKADSASVSVIPSWKQPGS